MAVIEGEAGDLAVGRVVRLNVAQELGVHGQGGVGRELALEQGIGHRRQAKLGAQAAEGGGPRIGHPLNHAQEHGVEAGAGQFADGGQAGRSAQHGRVIGRHHGEGGQNGRDPHQAAGVRRQARGIGRGMGDDEGCVLGGRHHVFIGAAQERHGDAADQEGQAGAAIGGAAENGLDVQTQFALHVRHARTQGVEIQSLSLDLAAEFDLTRNQRFEAPLFKRQPKRKEGVQVPCRPGC